MLCCASVAGLYNPTELLCTAGWVLLEAPCFQQMENMLVTELRIILGAPFTACRLFAPCMLATSFATCFRPVCIIRRGHIS